MNRRNALVTLGTTILGSLASFPVIKYNYDPLYDIDYQCIINFVRNTKTDGMQLIRPINTEIKKAIIQSGYTTDRLDNHYPTRTAPQTVMYGIRKSNLNEKTIDEMIIKFIRIFGKNKENSNGYTGLLNLIRVYVDTQIGCILPYPACEDIIFYFRFNHTIIR